jgi:hypothetical protein
MRMLAVRDLVPGDIVWAGLNGYYVNAVVVEGERVTVRLDLPGLGEVSLVRDGASQVEVARRTHRPPAGGQQP